MFQVAIFHDHPADPGSFDEHYAGLAAKMPGLLSFTTSWTRPNAGGAAARYHLLGAQEWADQAELDDCLESDETAAAIADLVNLDVAMTMIVRRTRQVV